MSMNLVEALRQRRIRSGIPRRESSDRVAMSSGQQRLWYLDRLGPGNLYLLPAAYRVEGRLDREALEWALNALVERHESLRTTFAAGTDGPPVQTVHASLRLDLPVTESAPETLTADLAAEANEPMNLAAGPLIRARLLRHGPATHVLLLTLHHIVGDGWSFDVLQRELSELYAARRDRRPVRLPEPAIQYPDFAAWQRDWLGGSDYQRQLSYWRDALAGAPEVLEITGDRPRPPVQSFAGRTVPVRIAGAGAPTRELCRRLEATPFMVLLAAFQVLLARYADADDVVVGTPVANRDRAELEGLIGFCANTLPVRTRLAGDPTFEEVVRQVREATVDAFGHQEMPFEALVDALSPRRRLDRSPVFQHMFLYPFESEEPLRLAGLTVTPIDPPSDTAKFDLTLSVRAGADDVEGVIEYSTDLFGEDWIARFVEHFGSLLSAATAEPSTRVRSAPILPAGQPVGWNDTAVEPAGPETVHGMFEAIALSTPDGVAVVDGQRRLTYAELDAESDRWASRLRSLGVGRGSVVGLCLPRSVELAVAMLAVLKAGAAYLPLDPAHPQRRRRDLIEDAGADIVLTSAEFGGRDDPPLRPGSVGPDDLAYVMYTSGSTGRPKGVIVTHRGVVNYVHWAVREYGIGPGDGAALHSTIAADLSVTSLLVPLLSGGTVHMVPDGPAELGELLGELDNPLGLVKITPAHLRIVRRQLDAARAGRGTRGFVIGGENLLAEDVAFWREHAPDVRLFNEYGPTETVVGCATYEITASAPETGSIPIGRPIDNTRLYVLDRYLNPAPAGVTGELYVGGAGVARGYLNRPGLTAERFVPDPFGEPGQRLYRTGDLARHRPDGQLEFLGRRDDQVKVLGHRVELGEVEAALVRQPDVREAAVVLRDERLIGYVAGAPGLSTQVLRAVLKTELPEHMVPSALVVVDAIPLTPNGKVDRAALPAPAVAVPAPQRGDLERTIAGVWSSVLGLDRVGGDENFFDVGGNSLLLLRVHAGLVELIGDRVSITDLFRHPTIRSLAEFLEPRQRVEIRPVAPPPGTAGGAIAIVAMACRYPGAATPEEFWASIRDGVEAVRPFSEEELLAAGADPVLLADPDYVRWGTVLDGIDRFDATAFGLAPREAEILDPQHRLFLECAWEALERAGYDPDTCRERIGVFAGSARSAYLTENLLTVPDVLRSVDAYQLEFSTGNDFLPTRVSYLLNLRGPSLSVNTACSTSLVAVHLARQSLLSGECDVALAGGVTIEPAQRRGYLYRHGGVTAPDGHCRPFDARAGGTIGSSGAGLVVLKRLEDALADGDPVLAVLRGSAVNNDGARKVGYTAPGVDGQAEVITRALAAAGVPARTVGYVEAHGTGTVLGDPIEIAALTEAYRQHTADNGFCAIGSVKANIGHTDAAAGVAGLIKTVMAMRHRTLPPSVNFDTPNPKIDFAGSPFYVSTECREWTNGDGPRRAGVSSFGIGGTNAHVVLEEAPLIPSTEDSGGPELLVLSARTLTALDAMTDRLAAHLDTHPEMSLAEAGATLRLGRRQFSHRRVVVCRDRPDAIGTLRAVDPERVRTGTAAGTSGVAFVFPGQGSEYPGMGAGLYRREPVFRETVDECAEILHAELGLDLRTAIRDPEELARIWLTQPAVFVTEYALARTLIERGVRPDAMAGHSLGEFAAACLSGVLPLEEALRLVAARGRLMYSVPAGAMLAVALPETEIEPLLTGGVSVAAVNSPGMCVLSGPAAGVDTVERLLRERDVQWRRLPISVAAHSTMMDAIVDEFVECARSVTLRAPELPYLSGVTGTWITAAEATDPVFWGRHLRQTVRFADCAKSLVDTGATIVEVGPGRALGNFVRQQGGRNGIVALMHATNHDEHTALLEGIGRIWLTGAPVDWAAFTGPQRRRISLPTYPFERRRYWIEPGQRVAAAAAPEVSEPVAEPDLPFDGVAAEVAAVWREVLGVTPASLDDNFFMLGGNSLIATQLLARLRERFAVDLRIAKVFDNPTVAGLASAIRGAGDRTPTRAVPRDAPATVPVSYGQRRMWFLEQAYTLSAAYLAGTTLELTGELDEPALRSALSALVRRHEALRTVFPAMNGEPVQEVLAPYDVELPVVPVPETSLAWQALLNDARRPFDLTAGPLFRATLYRIGPTHHLLSLCMHHMVSDGWSLGLIRAELSALYSSFVDGREPSLSESPAQYGDFTLWQTEQLTDRLGPGLTYWKRQLDRVPPSLELPTDRPRPPVQTFAGATTTRLLPVELADRLRALGGTHGATLYMTMLAGLHALLHHYTGATDICVGSPSAGRAEARFEHTVGFFVNMLPMRARLDGAMSFVDLLNRVRDAALGAYANQDVPFERLVDELKLPRDLSRSPLFQVMFNLMNLPRTELRMTGLRVEQPVLDAGTSQLDLAVYVYERDEGLDCHLEYNTDLFDAGTAERILGHYETILTGIAANPAIPIRDLDVLTRGELDRQLSEWNATGDDTVPALGIHELIEEQVRRTPNKTAVTFDGRSLTYAELDRRAGRIAAGLRAEGVGPEVLVAVALERSERLVVALLAILKAGGAYVPLDVRYPPDRQRYILEDSGANVLITQPDIAGRYAGYRGHTVLIDDELPEPEPAPAPEITPATAAYVIYTSGSTGRPKGVRVSHGAAVNFLHAMRGEPGLTASDTMISVASVAFDQSVLDLFLPLTVGARVVIAGSDAAHDPALLGALLTAENVTVMHVTPSTWRLLLSAGWPGMPTLRAFCGGEALPATLAAELRPRVAQLWNLYGPTEATVYTAVTRIEPGVDVTAGRPIANTQAYILDEAMRPVPVGVVAELYLGGTGLARDYLGQPGTTADRFVPNPHGTGGSRLYRTGDLARHRPDGTIEVLGRNDNQVKLRGYRIELGEIEAVLADHPSVREAAVTVVPSGDEKSLVAYLVPDEPVDSVDLREFLRARLPDYMVPPVFVTLDAFPLTPNGKLDRLALPAPEPVHGSGASRTEPRTPLETVLVDRWLTVLNVGELGIDDNFFDLGGDSFKAVRAVRDLPVPAAVLDVFKHPTIRELAAHLDGPAEERNRLLHELTPPRTADEREITVVCLPFAGAGAVVFQSLAAAMPKTVSLYAVEPPGHNVNRPDEPLLPLTELARRCVEEITSRITGRVVLYGHCMGGALTIEVARQLEAANADLDRVVIGAHFPVPRLPGRLFGALHRLFPMQRWTSKRRAMELLRAMGFFAEELDGRERDFVMNVVLADVQAGEDYYTDLYADPDFRPLSAPIVSVVGEADRTTELYQERHAEWSYFSDSVSLATIPDAGHYFQKHQADRLADVITHRMPAPAPVETPSAPPASIRTFLLVALGQFVSLIGTALTTFAMSLWVYQHTGSVSLFAVTSVAAILPAALLAPIAGAVADRVNRRAIMISADVFAGLGSLGLAALLWTDRLELWSVYLVVVIGAIANAFQLPAYLAAVTQLVPKRYYGKANGIVQLGTATGTVLAPLIGGALVVAIGLSGIILIDLGTFLFAVAITAAVRFPNTLFRKREEPFGQELLGGWRYIARRRGLAAIIAFSAALNFFFGMVEVLVTPLTLTLGDPATLGLVLAAGGIGLLAGSVAMSVWGGTTRRTTGILASFLLVGLSMILMGLAPSPLLPALGLFGMGLATATVNAHWLSLVQAKVGLELQGRVIATTLMLSWIAVPAGFLVAGPLAERIFEPLLASHGPGRGIALAIVLAGLCVVLLAAGAYRYRPVRLLEDHLPDVIPDPVVITDKNLLQHRLDNPKMVSKQ